MKRIVFLLKRPPRPIKRILFILRMKICGITVVYKKPSDAIVTAYINEGENLIVSDDEMICKRVREKGSRALVYLHSENDMDNFDEKYFIIDAEETEKEYFEKVYRRINNIPWEIAKTKRLILRETIEEDVDEFVRIYADSRMTEYTEGMYEAEAEKEYVSQYREKVYACQGFGIWTVIRKADGKIIGRAGLVTREGFEGAEAGFAIGCDYQGQGYATEALTETVKFANKEGLSPINALVIPENIASKRVLTKCGFSFLKNVNVQSVDYELWQHMNNSCKSN